MEHDALQRRTASTIKNMGVNSYSQIVSAFRAQGDLTDDQLNILPVLQNALGISRERHTAEVKRALYDEQLSEIASSINPSSSTTNWENEANYACPTIVHRPPNTAYVQLAEQVLKTTPPTTIIQHPQAHTTTKLNRDLQQLIHDEVKNDGIINATQQQQQQLHNPTKFTFTTPDIQGTKVVRLVRAKQATKPKSSLDTLIEVVQKELLRVNGQTNSNLSPASSPPSHYSQTRSLPSSKYHNRSYQSTSTPHRSMISSVLPSSHPNSLTSQSSHSFKIARRRGMVNSRKVSSLHQRNRSFDDNHFMENEDIEQSIEDLQSGPENIEEIVRETVDRIVALTLLNTAPYVVNMLTTVPNNGNNTYTDGQISLVTNNTSFTKSQSTIPKSDYHRNDLPLLSSAINDLRTSIPQASPIKLQQQQQQQQIHHPQLIIQPATTTPISTIQGTTTPTLFVAPRILNFQTVVPKPTTNIQIGNTKIILVSPSNITQHLPHSTTPTNQQTSNIVNNSSVKLVKFTPTNNSNNTNNSIPTRPTTATALPINTNQTSTLTLPKNVQIVIPSQTSASTLQLTRTHNDDINKSLPTSATTTLRSVTTVPMTLTTCAVDQIPQAAQEVTITTSPTSSPPLQTNSNDYQSQQSSLGTTMNVISTNTNNQQQYFLTNTSENNNPNNTDGSTIEKSRRRSASSAPTDKPIGKILRPITKVLPVYSPNNSNNNHVTTTDNLSATPTIQSQPLSNLITTRTSPIQDEMIKSTVAVNFQPQPPQIQRSTSTHGPMIYRMTSVNPSVPVFRVRATTAPTSTTVMNKSIKTDAKPISVTTATNMCYEPKPAHPTSTPSGSVSVLACFKTTKKRNKERAIMPRPSTNDSNEPSQESQQRLNPTTNSNTSLVLSSEIVNSNLSPDYQRQSSSSSTPTRLVQQTSLSSTHSDDNTSNILSLSMQEQINDTTTSSSNSIPISRNNPTQLNNSFTSIKTTNTPPSSPIPSLHSTPKTVMEDKCIQCINEDNKEEHPDDENSMEPEGNQPINNEQLITNLDTKRRVDDNDENWTVKADSLLRDILSQTDFHTLDTNQQQSLSSKFDILQTNLNNGTLTSNDEFFNTIIDIKQKLLDEDLSKTSGDTIEKLFNYFEKEYSKIFDQTNERKRIKLE